MSTFSDANADDKIELDSINSMQKMPSFPPLSHAEMGDWGESQTREGERRFSQVWGANSEAVKSEQKKTLTSVSLAPTPLDGMEDITFLKNRPMTQPQNGEDMVI